MSTLRSFLTHLAATVVVGSAVLAVEVHVVDPDGDSVAAATVAPALAAERVLVTNGEVEFRRLADGRPPRRTGVNGRVELGELPPACGLVVVADAGYAVVAPDRWPADGTVRLQPWASLGGTGGARIVDAVVAVHGAVQAGADGGPTLVVLHRPQLSATGTFAVDRVPATWVEVAISGTLGGLPARTARRVWCSPGSPGAVDLTPGSTAVRGSLAFTETPPPGLDWAATALWLESAGSEARFTAATADAWESALQARENAPETATLQAAVRRHRILVSPDGSFTIAGVEPGAYNLTGIATRTDQAVRLGRVVQRLTIPDDRDAVVDVGELPVWRRRPLSLGDNLSKVELPAFEGSARTFADFAGRVVVVHVWSPATSAGWREVRRLLDQWRALPDRDAVALVLLTVGPDPEVAAAAFRALDAPGAHGGHAGDWTRETWCDTVGVYGTPATFLLSPAGHLAWPAIRRSDRLADGVAFARTYVPPTAPEPDASRD